MEIVTGESTLTVNTAIPDRSGAPSRADAPGWHLSWAAGTDIGLKRADNQDSFLAAPPFFLVADGMGGHAGGKQASATLLHALEPFAGRPLGEPKFHRLLATACREVMDLADANLDYSISPPGTTLTGLVLVNGVLSPVHEAPSGDTGEDSQTRPKGETAGRPASTRTMVRVSVSPETIGVAGLGIPGRTGDSGNTGETGMAPHESGAAPAPPHPPNPPLPPSPPQPPDPPHPPNPPHPPGLLPAARRTQPLAAVSAEIPEEPPALQDGGEPGIPRQASGSGIAGETRGAPHAAAPPAELLVVNVGDSRTYMFAGGQLRQLTRDHSQVAQMLEAGLITPEMVPFMPNRSVITRAIGAGQTVLPQVDSWRLSVAGAVPDTGYNTGYSAGSGAGDNAKTGADPGETDTGKASSATGATGRKTPGLDRETRRFLVCSDGLHSLVRQALIERVLADAPTPEAAVKSLIEAALSAGGWDNVTAIVVDVTRENLAKTGELGDGFRAGGGLDSGGLDSGGALRAMDSQRDGDWGDVGGLDNGDLAAGGAVSASVGLVSHRDSLGGASLENKGSRGSGTAAISGMAPHETASNPTKEERE